MRKRFIKQMSGVYKITRGYFKLLRGQTASEKPAGTSEVLSCMHKSRRQSNAMGRIQDRKSTELDSISGLMPRPCNCTVPSVPITPPLPCPNKVICPQSTAFLKTFLNIQKKVYSVPPYCNKRRNYKSMHTYICISFYIHKTFYKLSKKIIVLPLQSEER